jgi:uncharacterized protein (TIGR01777 family)
MRVFVTGGTGLIGTPLIRRLRERQDSVVVLTRRPAEARTRLAAGCTIVEGDPTQPGPWSDALADCDAAINLAGENIFAQRWSEEFKARLLGSRVRSTQNVVQGLTRNPVTPDGRRKVLVNASAIGYYGPHGDEELTEDDLPGCDFLAGICADWEKAAQEAERAGVRVARVRVGVVLAREAGALAKMVTPFKLFAGGPIGSGAQWMSWIHVADIVGLFLLALDNLEATGPINGTAPHSVTNRDFAKALGRALHRPSFLPTPAFALRLSLGEVADVIATGQRVQPKRALALIYPYKFPNLDEALANLLG